MKHSIEIKGKEAGLGNNETLTLSEMTESRGKKVLKSLLSECQNTMA